jgi:hypothetical protein
MSDLGVDKMDQANSETARNFPRAFIRWIRFGIGFSMHCSLGNHARIERRI